MSLHLEFEPHSWYMGFAIRDNFGLDFNGEKSGRWTAVTDNGMTGYIDELEANTLQELRECIREYHLVRRTGYGERLATRRLRYLRGELQAGRMSYGEIAELQSLTPYVESDDVELLEAAGVPEAQA